MAAISSIIMGGSALLGVGLAAYSAMSQPEAPEVTAAPPPANYITYDYDDNGNPIASGSQVWDAATHSYIYKPRALTPVELAERKKRTEIRNQMLDNLNATPEDRVKAYEEYAVNFSKAAHKDVDKQYEKLVASTDENMNARGLMGSKAYADITAANTKSKLETDENIATNAALAKEELANTDRNYWLSVLSQLDSNANLDTISQLQKQNLAQQGATQGTASLLGSYSAQNNANMQNWATKLTQNQSNTNMLTNTASGLAYLYGYNTKKNPLSPSITSGISGNSYPATGRYSFLNN